MLGRILSSLGSLLSIHVLLFFFLFSSEFLPLLLLSPKPFLLLLSFVFLLLEPFNLTLDAIFSVYFEVDCLSKKIMSKINVLRQIQPSHLHQPLPGYFSVPLQ